MGVVIARTGRLSKSGDPLAFAMSRVEPELRRVKNGGPSHEVRLASRDSRSCADGTREAVRELVRDEGARIVLTLAGTEVLPAVADTCEEEGVPCVSGTFPWQVYYHGRGGTDRRPFCWTYHFCRGLDDIAETFADLWEAAGGSARTVGCLWNDGPQGTGRATPNTASHRWSGHADTTSSIRAAHALATADDPVPRGRRRRETGPLVPPSRGGDGAPCPLPRWYGRMAPDADAGARGR